MTIDLWHSHEAFEFRKYNMYYRNDVELCILVAKLHRSRIILM